MSFQIIKAENRTANMIVWLAGLQKKITDFMVGGKTRTKLEAIAVEMESQDMQFYIAAMKAISTAIYQAFDFQIQPAIKASGNVIFSASSPPASDITIPAGTSVATPSSLVSPEKTYQTIADATLPAGQSTVTVQVICDNAGDIGNTGAGTITVMKSTVSGIDAVTNPVAMTNGREKETEPERRVRFQQYIATLTRGTAAALCYAAKSVSIKDGNGTILERVLQVGVTEPPETGPAGSCDVVIYNGTGGASQELIQAVQAAIDGDSETGNPGYKAAGVIVTVKAATTVATPITVNIESLPGSDKSTIRTQAESIISTYFQTFTIGGPLIFHELAERIMGIEGVYNINLTNPTKDVEAAPSQILVAGQVTITMDGEAAQSQIPDEEPPLA